LHTNRVLDDLLAGVTAPLTLSTATKTSSSCSRLSCSQVVAKKVWRGGSPRSNRSRAAGNEARAAADSGAMAAFIAAA